ncbi:hypothetical protein MSM1_11190 [Mycobacterium sp. SM1]|uniref:hypothetical protein n=1 Tax=Mycobacterium sp. SM1 TaxID=2816243 RepID=UPI001BCD92D3|nr:hypothetical protein [Mycobacterium sp. SM1]MBS4728869.1 hypothetical protein [Mycobacterium sp. SM1]
MNSAASENPLGLGLIIVGAAALAISAFLPLVQPVSALRMVEDNTLIQHGGWVLIALALGIATSGYRVSRGRPKERWMPIILCAIAAALVLLDANDKDVRTLYPVRSDGTVDTSQPGMVASLGIAIYVAGAGVAAALIGSLILLQSAKQRALDDPLVAARTEAETKKCPDQPRPQLKRQRARMELEAEADAAEAEALAAEARARAIRLRREAEANAKQAPQAETRQSGRSPTGVPYPGPSKKNEARE